MQRAMDRLAKIWNGSIIQWGDNQGIACMAYPCKREWFQKVHPYSRDLCFYKSLGTILLNPQGYSIRLKRETSSLIKAS